MKLGIKLKLFIILLGASILIITCMFVFTRLSFERGLLQYVDKREMKRLELLCRILETNYADHGNWNFLTDSPGTWNALRNSVFKPRHKFKNRPYREHFMKGGRFHSDTVHSEYRKSESYRKDCSGMGMGKRWDKDARPGVILLDADKKKLFGKVGEAEAVRLIPVIYQGDPVGWLGVVPPKEISEEQELLFVRSQSRVFLMISIIMILISVAVAIWTAIYLERPIRILAKGTKQLTSGEFDIRIPVRSSDELGQLTSDFNTLARTLENNEQSRKQWVEDIAHELRTPLTLLSGELEAVQDGVRDLTPETLTLLQGDINRLIRLVSDLNELSKTDIGALTYKKERIDMNGILSQVIERFRDPSEAAGLTLNDSELNRNKVYLSADGERLSQLFENLIENSICYTNSGGSVKIWSELTQRTITVHIQDSGPGVPVADLDRLFDRMFRVDASRNRTSGGTGIGLAICKNITEAHGGKISASPSPLGGLWIKVTLPV